MDFTIVYASELMDRIRKSNALLVDIREKEDYEKGHWPGAVNYPYDDISRGKRYLPKGRKLILYCEHGVCWGRKAIRWQLLWEVMKQ